MQYSSGDDLRLAIQDNIYFDIETLNSSIMRKSYTYDTIQLLKRQNPKIRNITLSSVETWWIITRWHHVDE